VRELRLKNAECSHKVEEIEAKVAGAAVLTTPQREYMVKNSIAWQKVTRSVDFIGKLPKCGKSYGLERGQYMFKCAIPEKSSLAVAY
jgi:hypothetical protein